MSLLAKFIQVPLSGLVRVLLGAYFRRIEVLHRERLPPGPVLVVANHPGSFTDAFILGTLLPRRGQFLAAAKLFRFAPVGWLLHRCGIIPLNRLEDDPSAMRSVTGSFAAAFRALEAGGMVVIFPEGVTYDDSRLRTLKSGAARLALELELRHGGQLGLQIVPLGLTYSAKERFRSEVLVYLGAPIPVANFLPQFTERRKECINGLTAKITRRLQALLVHLPEMEREHIVAAVKRLYFARLRLGNLLIREPVSALVEETILTQAIVDALAFAEREMPDELAAFLVHLNRYERLLAQLRLTDSAVEELAAHRHARARIYGVGLAGLVLFPVALLGWMHWRPVTKLIDSLSGRFLHVGKRKAQAAHARMLGGLLIYVLAYAIFVTVAWGWLSPLHMLLYGLALPVTGLVGHYYFAQAGRLYRGVRTAAVLLRAPLAKHRVLWMRAALLKRIEAMRARYRGILLPDGSRPVGEDD